MRQHPTLGEINEARVIEDGREVAVGEVGELQLRNPAVMLGYWGMPEETAEVLVDGWLRTGDLVRREPGGLFTFVDPPQGGDPEARGEPGAGRGRGGARRAPGRGRGGGGRGPVRICPRRR